MRPAVENIVRRFSSVPMLLVLVAVVSGIIIADWFTFPLWSLLIGIFVLLVNVFILPRGAASVASLLGSLMLLAIVAFDLSERALPQNYQHYEIEIERITSRTSSRTSGEARVLAIVDEGVRHPCSAEIRFTADSTLYPLTAHSMSVYCRVKPFNRGSDNSYERYMSRRGMAGSVWLTADAVVVMDTLPSTLVQRIGAMAEERVESLALSSDVQAVVKAVTIGRTGELSNTLREDYRRSGAAHLLAVSGLHVGFVCAIVGALLILLLLLPHGQIVRGVTIVVIIWLYAAVVGFTPSIVRAALMFSLLQIAITLSSRALSINTLCFAAVVMLLWNPRELWEAGFLLSCIAVAAIVEWGVPLIGWLSRKIFGGEEHHRPAIWRTLLTYTAKWLLAAVVVSFVASAATLPLSASMFGLSSLWALLAGPFMVLMCAVVVGLSLVWILFPIGVLQPLFAGVIGFSTSAMNDVAAWCASQPALIFEQKISTALCLSVYLIYLLLTLVVWACRR